MASSRGSPGVASAAFPSTVRSPARILSGACSFAGFERLGHSRFQWGPSHWRKREWRSVQADCVISTFDLARHAGSGLI
eukprot:6206489-Pleurochrysis_carterae.AAC.2